MARKCPHCGKELVENPNRPESLLCTNCNKNFKKDKSPKKEKPKKKKGGSALIIIIIVLLLLAIAAISIFFFIKNKEAQSKIEITIPAELIDEQTQAQMAQSKAKSIS